MKTNRSRKSTNLLSAPKLSASGRTRQPAQMKMIKEISNRVKTINNERDAPARAAALGMGDISKKMENAKQTDRAKNLATKKRTR